MDLKVFFIVAGVIGLLLIVGLFWWARNMDNSDNNWRH